MSLILLTGFPGFLCSALVDRLLERYPRGSAIACIVQSKYRNLAERRKEELERRHPDWTGRIDLLDGDITLPDLGLGGSLTGLQRQAVEIYHLAAVYDLGVSRSTGMSINVEGTRNMLRFAEACPGLRRFHYVSTCYVSGRYEGVFGEDDLEKGQAFNNYYEETKYLAEVEVHSAMRAGLPSTIYRPAITVGDSRTGETQKYDGPYYVIRWILRQRRLALVTVVGDTKRHVVNVVPRDFVVDALACLSGLEASAGRVYQLCDPNPATVDELLEVIARSTRRRLIRVRLPLGLAKASLEYVPGLRQWMGIEPNAIDYFLHPTRYTCENTLRDLQGTSIACPPFAEYAERLVSFVESHPEISSDGMS